MSEDVKNNLKLIGNNQEDLRVISAYSQDSIVATKDMIFLKKNRIFVMVVNRFMWEDIEKGIYRQNKRIKKGIYRQNKRIKCAIKFEGILKVKSKKINQKNGNKRLECLAIKCNEILNKNYKINFFFAGGGMITLISESVDVTMNDLGASWNVKHIPKHKI